MESEKGWAVWDPMWQSILFYTIASQEEIAIHKIAPGGGDNWTAMMERGYRTVPVTITYEKPGASDGK